MRLSNRDKGDTGDKRNKRDRPTPSGTGFSVCNPSLSSPLSLLNQTLCFYSRLGARSYAPQVPRSEFQVLPITNHESQITVFPLIPVSKIFLPLPHSPSRPLQFLPYPPFHNRHRTLRYRPRPRIPPAGPLPVRPVRHQGFRCDGPYRWGW